MDYDRTNIPAGYDRGRDHGPAVLDLWMNAIALHLDGHAPERIVDLGCGTGRFSDALAVRFNAEVTGLDPSLKMLNEARGKHYVGQVSFGLGRAEAIPLRSKSVDILFLSMSLHHFNDPSKAAEECRRILREGGSVFVRTGSREQIPFYPYYPFFPASHPILEEVLPDCAAVRGIFEAAGFRTTASEILEQTIANSWEVYADKLAANADSVLARLDRQDFEAGIAAVRRHAAEGNEQPIIEPIDLFVFR